VTELLVVVAIIAILVSLLLVALARAKDKALDLRTTATMTEFAKACDTFQLDHGRYPGPVPETALPANSPLSGMELALLELMGGIDVFHPTLARDPNGDYAAFVADEIVLANNWRVKIRCDAVGDGPIIDGKPYAPYFTPSKNDLAEVEGQVNGSTMTCPFVGSGSAYAAPIPDLVDAWGQPILYLRQGRPTGDLAGAPGSSARFTQAGILPYVQSTALGELTIDQTNGTNGSILNLAADPNATLAQLLRAPAFGAADAPQAGTPRGAVALFSAGADGIYFSVTDGPGTSGDPVIDIVTDPATNDPKALDEYDDIRVFTGG
jgi:type II secretory pathway pseudopilin PulG